MTPRKLSYDVRVTVESRELLLSIVVKESDGFKASPHCGILIDRKVYGKVTKPPISGWELLPLFKIKLMDFATIMAMAVLVSTQVLRGQISTQPGHEILHFVRTEVTEKYQRRDIGAYGA